MRQRKMNNNYFFKVKFEDGTEKIIEVSEKELWGIIEPDIDSYCQDTFIDPCDPSLISEVWIGTPEDTEIDLDEYFKDYRINTSVIEYKFPEHKNEDVCLETIKEGTYEYVLCELANKQSKLYIDFETEELSYRGYDAYSDDPSE